MRWRRNSVAFIIFLFLVGISGIIVAENLAFDRTGYIVTVEMQLDRDSVVGLFWNDFDEPPVRKAVEGGAPRTIEFIVPPVQLRRLRIDPTEIANQTVTLRAVSLQRRDDQKLVNIPLDDIVGWIGVGVSPKQRVGDTLQFRSITNDPFIVGPVDLPLPRGELIASRISKYVVSNLCLPQLILVGAALVSLVSLSPVAAVLFCLLCSLPLAFLYFAEPIFRRLGVETSYDVSTAVGHAALNGLSVDASRWGSLAAGLLCMALGLSFGSLIRNSLRPVDVAASGPPMPWPSSPVVVSLWFAALAFVLVPDFFVVAQLAASRAFVPLWDYNNWTAWVGFIARGDRPFVDFWYPYSGLWTFELPLPRGDFIRFVYKTCLYGVVGIGMWRLVRHRFGLLSFALAAFVVLLSEANVLDQPFRYLLSVAVALTYAAVDRKQPLGKSGRAWFWLAFAIALWGEPLQAVYAAPGVLIVLLLAEFPIRRDVGPSALKRFFLDFGVPALSILCLALFFALRGELSGVIETNLQTSGNWIYAVIPTDLRSQFGWFTNIAAVGLFGTYFLIFLGTSRAFGPADAPDIKLARAIQSCGLIDLLVFQKHWLRPIQGQLLEPVVIGALLVFALYWGSYRARAVATVFAGAIVAAIAIDSVVLDTGKNLLFSANSRFASSVSALYDDKGVFAAANKAAFARERFAAFPEELMVSDRLNAGEKGAVFVAGDMPLFYLFAPGPVPYQINHYSSAPIRAQLMMESWLRQIKPEHVVVNGDFLTFDGVQYTVRVPLLAIEVMLNYKSGEKIGRYYLTARRSAQDPIDLNFWKGVYGPTINYGYIPSYSQADRWPACVSQAPDCSRYLRISFQSDVNAPQLVSVPVDVGGTAFEITFTRIPGKRDYFLRLDRVWFWALGEAMGSVPHVLLPPDAGYTAEQVQKLSVKPTLY